MWKLPVSYLTCTSAFFLYLFISFFGYFAYQVLRIHISKMQRLYAVSSPGWKKKSKLVTESRRFLRPTSWLPSVKSRKTSSDSASTQSVHPVRMVLSSTTNQPRKRTVSSTTKKSTFAIREVNIGTVLRTWHERSTSVLRLCSNVSASPAFSRAKLI